jgi:tRNA A-37 threonylcarbamoyl transferase component Bud32
MSPAASERRQASQAAPSGGELLKSGARRSVALVRDAQGVRVLKRYHARGALARARDARRAREEHALLARLHALGLPVPRPLGIQEGERGPELVLEWIEGARPLAALYKRRHGDGALGWPIAPERAARALGTAFGRFCAAGLDHPDLHAGNALLDAHGQPYLVDLAGARLRRSASARRVQRDLVALAADSRESLSRRWRMRFLLALLAALPSDVTRSLPPPRELARRVEERGRVRRRAVLERARARWLRESGVVRAFELELGEAGVLQGFARRALELEPGSAFAELLSRALRRTQPPTEVLCHEGQWLLARRASLRTLEHEWRELGRARQHRLSSARPLLLLRAPRPLALYELPAELHSQPARGTPRWRAALRSLAGLLAALRDRGLTVERVDHHTLGFAANGDLLWLPGTCLRTRSAARERQELLQLEHVLGPLTNRHRR